MEKNFDVLIVGGGTGGLTVASRLIKRSPKLKIGIIEPSTVHYYQPLWTLVGGGIVSRERSKRDQKDFIPDGVTWIQDRVTSFQPEKNQIFTDGHGALEYKQLVISMGIHLHWEGVKGLRENIGKHGVCSNYSYETVNSTWTAIQNFESGNAIFTFPKTVVKCAGAPQKIMWLAEHYFRKKGIRDRAKVIFISGQGAIFGVEKYKKALEKLLKDRNIETYFKHNLLEINAPKSEAVIENMETGAKISLPYNLIHVTPPQGPPEIIKQSSLADANGWLDVNKQTLQHTKFANVFGLGDCTNTPNSKAGAAIRKQAPVLIGNLLAARSGLPLNFKYDGYASCPLVTGYGKLILAEFNYEGKPVETFPFDQSKERLSMYLMKKHLLPKLYWDGMLRGRA